MSQVSSISLTSTILVTTIHRLGKTPEKSIKGFCKREIFSRLIACTTFLFRAADFGANLAAGIGMGAFYMARKASFRHIPPDDGIAQKIKAYFNGAVEAAGKDPLQMFKLIVCPYPNFSSSKPDPLYELSAELSSAVNLEKNAKHSRAAAENYPDALVKVDRKKIAAARLLEDDFTLDSNWGLTDFFGHIYVLNLDDNPGSSNPQRYEKRLQNAADELKKIGVSRNKFERFRAIHGATELDKSIWDKINETDRRKTADELEKMRKGQAGNFVSHYSIIKDASDKYDLAMAEFKALKKEYAEAPENRKETLQNKLEVAAARVKEYSSIIIIEDDNGFGFLKHSNNANGTETVEVSCQGTGKYFHNVMCELPENWDLFYFMAEHGYARNLKSVSSTLNRLYYGVCLNAYAINHTAYQPLLETLGKIFQDGAKVRPTDHMIASLHSKINVFVPKNPLAFQSAGNSSISDGSGETPWNGLTTRSF